MKKTTLCFCLKPDEILLGLKLEGFGEGKINGPGGKIEGNESIKTAAARELNEEFCLVAEEEDLVQVAFLHFYFDGNHIFDCYVFFARQWQGEPAETKEMRPKWYPLSDIPYKKMWIDDVEWLPLVLAGGKNRSYG